MFYTSSYIAANEVNSAKLAEFINDDIQWNIVLLHTLHQPLDHEKCC